MELNLTIFAAIWATVLFAAILRSFSGFGFALAAVPVFSAFLSPTDSVVLSSLLTLALSMLSRHAYWGVVPLKPMIPLAVTTVIGTAIGAAVLSNISTDQFRLWAGISVIFVCVIMTVYHPKSRPENPLLGALAGSIAGFMNGVLAIPGPPVIALTMLTEPDPRLSRAKLMTFLLGATAMALLSYAIAGFFSLSVLVYFLLAYPAAYIGDKIGHQLFSKFGQRFYRQAAIGLLFAIGVSATLSTLLQ